MTPGPDDEATLRLLVERLEGEPSGSPRRAALLAEAREQGWNPAVLEQLLVEHRLDPGERARAVADLDRYRVLLGDESVEASAERVLRAAAAGS